MSQPVSPVKPARRRRSLFWLKAIGVILLIIGLIYGYRTWINYRDEKALYDYIAKLDASDPSWKMTQLLQGRQPLPPGTDAAAEVVALQKLLNIHEMIPIGTRNAWWKKLREIYDKHTFEHWEYFRGMHPNALVPDATREQLTALFAMEPAPGAFQRARLLRNLKQGQYQYPVRPLISMTLLPDVQGSRHLSNLMGFAAQLHGEAGNIALALEYIEGCFGIARSFDADPFFISHLVRMAIVGSTCREVERLLAQSTPLTDAQLQLLQREIVREHQLTRQILAWMVRSERAAFDHDLATLQEGRMTWGEISRTLGRNIRWRTNIEPVDDALLKVFPEMMVGWGNRPETLAKERLTLLKFFAAAMEWAGLPEEQLQSGLKEFEERGPYFTNFLREYSMIWLYEGKAVRKEFAGFQKMLSAVSLYRTRLRTTEALLACERFRLATGQMPAGWKDIVPAYLPAIPLDPYNGKPITLHVVPDGVVLYSVGHNQMDDKGQVHEQEEQTATDVGCKLWKLQQRGLKMESQWQTYRKSKATDE